MTPIDEPLRIAALLPTSEVSKAWITWKANTIFIAYVAGLLEEPSVNVADCGLSVAVALPVESVRTAVLEPVVAPCPEGSRRR
jgi:hypothetical protein